MQRPHHSDCAFWDPPDHYDIKGELGDRWRLAKRLTEEADLIRGVVADMVYDARRSAFKAKDIMEVGEMSGDEYAKLHAEGEKRAERNCHSCPTPTE